MNKLADRELKARIASHAKYIEQWILDNRLYDRPSFKDRVKKKNKNEVIGQGLDGHPEKDKSFHDFDGFMSELQTAEKDLKAAHEKLSQLRNHFSKGVMIPFENVTSAVNAASGLAAQACVAVGHAVEATREAHPDSDKTLRPQRVAVWLAWVEIGDKDRRAVRGLAKKIIESVRPSLKTPSEGTLNTMVNEAEEKAKLQAADT